MCPPPLAYDPRLARQIKAPTLEPHQQPTSPQLKTAVDFRQQVMRKYPFLADFHCRAEHLHAGLLEGESAITSYVPHPFRLRIGKRFFTPGCYVVSDRAPRRVVALRPDGAMPEDTRIPLEHFFAQYNMVFEVVSNEAVFAREVEAENWLEIVRILHLARDLPTPAAEDTVLDTLHRQGACTLGDLIDPGDRARTYEHEIALFRLLYRGHVTAALTEQPLDYDTGIALCA